ncbi:MAG TPA: DUF1080 domain-containing protein [Armatimonadota bacterium]|nr:DUF1080 domain-containing protein [Armatimonadota bacterium]
MARSSYIWLAALGVAGSVALLTGVPAQGQDGVARPFNGRNTEGWKTKAPGEWQKFVIEFQAPRFEGDRKVSNAKFLKVTLNGQVIHENVEMKGVTPTGVTGKEAPTGPLMFQGDHGPVSYRNIRITPRTFKPLGQ